MPDTLDDARKVCGCWEEDLGCDDDYPEDCPIGSKCKEEALSND